MQGQPTGGGIEAAAQSCVAGRTEVVLRGWEAAHASAEDGKTAPKGSSIFPGLHRFAANPGYAGLLA